MLYRFNLQFGRLADKRAHGRVLEIALEIALGTCPVQTERDRTSIGESHEPGGSQRRVHCGTTAGPSSRQAIFPTSIRMNE